MNFTRPLTRAAPWRAASGAARPRRIPWQLRLQSTTPPSGSQQHSSPSGSTTSGGSSSGSSSSGSAASSFSPMLAGVAGGVVAGVLMYGMFRMSPSGQLAGTVNKQVAELRKAYNEAAAQLQRATPDAEQTVGYIKHFCYSYVAWVPGGRQYVDAAFRDWDRVREKHRDEADALVRDAYARLQKLSRAGLSMDAARQAADVLAEFSTKLASLATDAAADVLDNHPGLKDKLGGSVDTLRQMGEQFGPEVKKQVEDTWKRVAELASGGLSADKLNEARKLLEDKVEALRKMGDDAWKKGLEGAKPYLDKAPKVRQMVEENADALKSGNAKELFDRVRNAVESGDTGDLEGYVKSIVNKVKNQTSSAGKSLGLDKTLGSLPAAAADILPKLQQLKEVADKHTDEAEQLVKETLDEVKTVLESKQQRVHELLGQAKKEAKEAKDSKDSK